MVEKWNGLDIARIQTAFNVSYHMILNRLNILGILNDALASKLELEKIEKCVSKLLSIINGNINLCRPAEVKRVPTEYIKWVVSNYTEKLISFKSLETVLNYCRFKSRRFLYSGREN